MAVSDVEGGWYPKNEYPILEKGPQKKWGEKFGPQFGRNAVRDEESKIFGAMITISAAVAAVILKRWGNVEADWIGLVVILTLLADLLVALVVVAAFASGGTL